jgi:uncharacterized membrane protein
MALMALDHCRDFVASGQDLLSPLDPATTNGLRYFTRWATHICAPLFFFLAGVGIRLSLERGPSSGRSRRGKALQLLARGALLMGLEFTVVRFAWSFGGDPKIFLFQVIWALGAGMMVAAAFVFASDRLRLIFGCALCLSHNLFDHVAPAAFGSWGWLWTLVHAGGRIPLDGGDGGYVLAVSYPLIPWIGLMPLGMAAGRLWAEGRPGRAGILAWCGAALLAAFVLLRLWGGYGDPRDWTVFAQPTRTLYSFLNVTKYPPSLLYLLAMLGLSGLVLALAERPWGRLGAWLGVFGRTPLFFYVVHLFVLHGLAVGVAYLRFGRADWLFALPWAPRPEAGPGSDWSLGWVYAVWLACLVALYPACRLYGRLRSRSPGRWGSLL